MAQNRACQERASQMQKNPLLTCTKGQIVNAEVPVLITAASSRVQTRSLIPARSTAIPRSTDFWIAPTTWKDVIMRSWLHDIPTQALTCMSVTISPTDFSCRAALDSFRLFPYTLTMSAVFTCTPIRNDICWNWF
jgi:hypothetical protein